MLSSCSTPSVPGGSSVVRKLDTGTTPQMRSIAERARKTSELTYPAVCALLNDGTTEFSSCFDISFKRTLPQSAMAVTCLDEICLNIQFLQEFEDQPAVLEEMMVHEMAHVAQHYYRRLVGHWLIVNPRPPAHWVEGIADYVCFKLGVTNGLHCAECTSVFPSYTDGYSCAGAFLLYLEREYNPNIVPQLNRTLRQGRYTDSFFFVATGKELSTLWAEFRRTEAFTPNAARMLELRDRLGFVNAKAPKDFDARLRTYLREHADERTRQMLTETTMKGPAQEGIQTRLALVYYFTQPGGAAEAFVTDLQERGELPGFTKGQHGQLSGFLGSRELNLSFPVARSFIATKQGETGTYHYTIYRTAQNTGWELLRAWLTDADGQWLEDYPVR